METSVYVAAGETGRGVGTLLYATLFEAIGLQPVMVFKKGHAFIGWKPSKYDKTKAPMFFLETTLTGGPATFEQAMESGTRTFLKAAAEKQFDLRIWLFENRDAIKTLTVAAITNI